MIDAARQEALSRPAVLTVAGCDSAGMAGLHADIRSQQAMAVHCAAAVSATTAQAGGRVRAINPVSSAALGEQLAAGATLGPRVMKAGLLCNREQVEVLRACLSAHPLPLVLDPVMAASSGDVLAAGDMLDALREQLLPRCHLLTPNLEEAEALARMPADTPARVEDLARVLVEDSGAQAVLIKGGHARGDLALDYFHGPGRRFWLASPRRPAGNHRGTGCAMASVIAAALALDYSLEDAVVIGKMAINQGLRQGYASGGEAGPVNITHFPDQAVDLPWLQSQAPSSPPPAFPSCGGKPLGLYPIVDRADWLHRLLPLGISTAQLRVKDLSGKALDAEIAAAVSAARRYGCRLFINDYWEAAIAHGAYGVHLGQEDLADADLARIRAAGLRLGISTHCHYEVAAAHAARPSYMACGPVFHTDTKAMPWTPHEPKGLAYWRRVMADYPLVAIGGINAARLPEVAGTGVEGAAVITAITRAGDPEAAARELMAALGTQGPGESATRSGGSRSGC